MRWRLFFTSLVMCLALASFAMAADSTIRLKDGTVLVGELKKYGSSYGITLPDGSRKMIPASEIVEIDGKPVGDSAATPTATAAGPNASKQVGSAAFEAIKRKADRAEQAIVGMKMWDEWIKQNPGSPDLAQAEAELSMWEARYNDRAEKVHGKWLVGNELKQLKTRVTQLMDTSFTIVEEGNQRYRTIDGVRGLRNIEEVLKIYPQSFEANFQMGLYHLVQITQLQGFNRQVQKSKESLLAASKIRPDLAEVWSNLAIVHNFLGEYEASVNAAWKATEIKDSKETVQQLANALYDTPPAFRRVNRRVAEIEKNAVLLFQKHGVGGPTGWLYLRPDFDEIQKGANDPDLPPGLRGNGSGFFITPDGYLLTNRHVIGDMEGPAVPTPDTVFRIRMDDGKERLADIVAVDDKWDIALLKMKVDAPVDYLKLAKADPKEGEDVIALGYPANGTSIKQFINSPGSVKSIVKSYECHVWFEMFTTNGNSGGPVVDAAGNLIAIVTQVRVAEHTANQFRVAMGVGPEQIADFFERIGDKAPKNVEWVTYDSDLPAFDKVKLIERCRKATLLVMSINTRSIDAQATVRDDPKETTAEDPLFDEDKEGDKPDGDEPEDGEKPDEDKPEEKSPEGSFE